MKTILFALAPFLFVACGSATEGPPGEIGPLGPPGETVQIPASGSLVTGPKGETGARGADGAMGAPGAAGAAGMNGAQGIAGPMGAPGPQGAQGAAGTNGTNGMNGAMGAQGAAGANGAQGPAGAPGPGITKSDVYVVAKNATVTSNLVLQVQATCADTNDVLLAGGCEFTLANSVYLMSDAMVPASLTDTTTKAAWNCVFRNSNPGSVQVTTYAYCITVP